jgi:hypothetical protein
MGLGFRHVHLRSVPRPEVPRKVSSTRAHFSESHAPWRCVSWHSGLYSDMPDKKPKAPMKLGVRCH